VNLPGVARVALLHDRQLRTGAEGRQVAALFRDVDVAVLIDAEQIGNDLCRDATEDRAVARPHDVDLLLRHEEGPRAEDGLEPAHEAEIKRTKKALESTWRVFG